MSIRLRLTLWYTGILTAILLVIGLGLYFFIYYSYYNGTKEDLQTYAENVKARIELQESLDGMLFFNFGLVGRDLLKYDNMYFQVSDFINMVNYRSPALEQADVELPALTEKKIACVMEGDCRFEKIQIEGISFLVYYAPITLSGQQLPGEAPLGMMQAAIVTQSTERVLGLLRIILTFTALVTILIAASVGWFLARKALRPIEQVIVAANRIGKGVDLDQRIEYAGPNDEIGELTRTINGMLERLQLAYSELEEAYSTQRRFVSDASHELRTPLTTIRGNVDLLERMWGGRLQPASQEEGEMKMDISLEAMRDISGEAERMSRLVNDLLSLARADAGFQMSKNEVELRPLLDEVARKAQMLPRTIEFRVGDLSAVEGVCVHGNPDYLQQLLFIFIENAFKYTEQGYTMLSAVRDGEQVGIGIEDTGIGMDAEEVPHIFERFYRADPSRGKKSGTGLGLSIAKWIIDEHRGSVEVRTLKDKGTAFLIWLPVSSSGEEQPSLISGHSLPHGNQV